MYLIMSFQEGDGCTYWCTNVLPIEAESPEAAAIAFEEAYNQALNHRRSAEHGYSGEFVIFGHRFESIQFDSQPNFQTIDEWFEANRGNEMA